MKKRLVPIIILIAYSALLVKVMIFKDVPLIRIGSLMLNFGGTAVGEPNFIPFKTIFPYLMGYKGWIIAGLNLFGNIVLLVPIGVLVPLVFRNIAWKKMFAVAAAAGFIIEGMQVLLRVGIFDIDDVILNGVGVLVGYVAFLFIAYWIRSKKYKNIVIAAAIVLIAGIALIYSIFGQGQPEPGNSRESGISQGKDLCNGTGGNGEIVSTGNNTFILKYTNGRTQTINVTQQTAINTSHGSGSVSELKTGDKVTLVGGPNPDGSFTAEAIFVCSGMEE